MGRVLLVCGTGTGIGKTHFSTAFLRRAARDHNAAGFKPIESGCCFWDPASDHAQLAAASALHVKHPPAYCLAEPVSPHLAARHEGRTIELPRIVERTTQISEQQDLLLVELAGGLFSPLSESALNVDLVRKLQRALPKIATILVAPNRLGVLHDIGATSRAAAASNVTLDGIVLSAAAEDDLSSVSNAAEIPIVSAVPVLGTIPRRPVEQLENHAVLDRIYSLLFGIFSLPASSR